MSAGEQAEESPPTIQEILDELYSRRAKDTGWGRGGVRVQLLEELIVWIEDRLEGEAT